MSNIGDKLQSAFAQMAKESSASANSKRANITNSAIAKSLGSAANAYQLNDVTEITSGFANLYGNKNTKPSFTDDLFDSLDLAGLDQVEPSEFVDNLTQPSVNGDDIDSANSHQNTDTNTDAQTNTSNSSAIDSSLLPEHQSNYDLLTQSIDTEFSNALNDLSIASSRNQRRDATDSLFTFTRQYFPHPGLMQSIAQSQQLSESQKQFELGRFAVLVLKMEFLIGWCRLDGSNQNSVPTWERSAPDNLDEFYTSDDAMGGGDGMWCSRFAGYARKRLGFRDDLISHLLFNSGLRLYEWSVNDRTHDHIPWPTKLNVSDPTNQNLKVIQTQDFIDLVATLDTSSDKATDVNAFFADSNRFEPQAGDLCILGRSGNRWKTSSGSHTVTVEKYDVSSQCIYTIEGNYTNRVLGRKLDLKDTSVTEEMLYIIRPSSMQHLGNVSFNQVLSPTQINQLFQGMQTYLEALANVATSKQYFLSDQNDALVYSWFTGDV